LASQSKEAPVPNKLKNPSKVTPLPVCGQNLGQRDPKARLLLGWPLKRILEERMVKGPMEALKVLKKKELGIRVKLVTKKN